MPLNQVIIVMGVSGSGKSTIGALLAQELQIPFWDADDFHPPANVAKMRSGTPLTDEDRQGWLRVLAARLPEWSADGAAVLACSALKESYRQQLMRAAPVVWIVLEGSEQLVRARLTSRRGHYMGPDLLASQFADLERPAYGLHLPIDTPPPQLVSRIVAYLQPEQPAAPASKPQSNARPGL